MLEEDERMRISLDGFQVFKIEDEILKAPVYAIGLIDDIRIVFPEGGTYHDPGNLEKQETQEEKKDE
jgi:hypothetical protein